MNEEELKKKIIQAKKASQKASKLKSELFDMLEPTDGLEDMEEIEFDGATSDNLKDALSCYIDYNEGKVEPIMEAIIKVTN